MRHLEAVIFDWAGTTVDYGCFAPVQAFIGAFREFGIIPEIHEVRKPMGLLKIKHIETMLEMERIAGLWREVHGRDWNQADVEGIYNIFEDQLMKILDQFTEPNPLVIETVQKLREMNIKIGSTTGYTDAMMEVVTAGAREKGYAPDVWFSPDSTDGIGRPYPYMIFKNMEALKVSSVKNVIKIGDTIADIEEGKNAGVWTVGVVEGSSELGLTKEEFDSISEDTKEELILRTKKRFKEAGADTIIRKIDDIVKWIR